MGRACFMGLGNETEKPHDLNNLNDNNMVGRIL